MEKVYFAKTREVKSPTRGTSKASGIDMYVPRFTDKFIEDLVKKNPEICDVHPGSYEYILSLSRLRKQDFPCTSLPYLYSFRYRMERQGWTVNEYA